MLSKAAGTTSAKPARTAPKRVKPAYSPNPALKPTKSVLLKLKKEHLQIELKSRGLETEGTKEVLVARLQRALAEPESAAAPKLPTLNVVAEPLIVPAEEIIPEQPSAAPVDVALSVEIQKLQAEKAELENALHSARTALDETLKKDAMEKMQLKECMMAIEQLAAAGDADRVRLEAAAEQLVNQLAEAERESAELQKVQQLLAARVTEVTRTLQEKEGEVAGMQGQLEALREMAGQVASVEVLTDNQVVLNLDPASMRPAYPALVVLAGGSMMADAAGWVWNRVRATRPAAERMWVDAAGIAAAAVVVGMLLQHHT